MNWQVTGYINNKFGQREGVSAMDMRTIIKSRKIRDTLMYGLRLLPDRLYVSLFYFALNGRFPNLRNPKRFTEKLQWLKLYDHHPEYRVLADKLAVREHVEKILGPGYTIPVLGKWKRFEDIAFSKLPNEFILKCNHDSGSYRIIHDKKSLTKSDYEELKTFFNRQVQKDFFYAGREDCYRDIDAYIFAEKLMHSSKNEAGGIKDFKFFCFNGEPKIMLMVNGRQTEKHEDYFDMDFNWLHIQNGWTESKVCPEKPACFEEMKETARILSKGLRHVRLDLYEIDGKIYFGEYTFFNGGGFEVFKPEEWELKMGTWINLPLKKRK